MIDWAGHRRGLFAAYLVLVLVLLLSPINRELPSLVVTWSDKVAHFVLFAGVALLGYWNQPSSRAVIVFAVVLAGGIELAQGPLPYRSAETWDFVAGAIGGFSGGWLASTVRR